MHMQLTFTILVNGTVSTIVNVPGGYRLESLELPALDSATLTLDMSEDGVTFRPTYDSAGVANGAIGGAANTGNRFLPIPEVLSRMTEGRNVRITLGAAQSGGARTINAHAVGSFA
jgi:hypothetical protein